MGDLVANLFLTSLAIAGVAVLWRTTLQNASWLRKYLNKALTCGVCFTFWLTLAVILIFDPLNSYLPPLRLSSINSNIESVISILFSWMAVGLLATIIRFSYAALEETVHYLVHHLNKREH